MSNRTIRCEDKDGAERGSSLIEVMVALMIMLFLMIGVLQLFSMAYLVNLGSGARTEMTSKAEQVIENMRCLQALTKGGATAPSNIGITFPIAAAASGDLDPTADPYWGPAGANVFPTSNSNDTPFTIHYAIEDANPYWRITVSVLPTDKATNSSARQYQGAAIGKKRVDYVATLLK